MMYPGPLWSFSIAPTAPGGEVQSPMDNVLLSATHSGKGVGVEEQFISAAVGSPGLLMKALKMLSSHRGVILR